MQASDALLQRIIQLQKAQKTQFSDEDAVLLKQLIHSLGENKEEVKHVQERLSDENCTPLQKKDCLLLLLKCERRLHLEALNFSKFSQQDAANQHELALLKLKEHEHTALEPLKKKIKVLEDDLISTVRERQTMQQERDEAKRKVETVAMEMTRVFQKHKQEATDRVNQQIQPNWLILANYLRQTNGGSVPLEVVEALDSIRMAFAQHLL